MKYVCDTDLEKIKTEPELFDADILLKEVMRIIALIVKRKY